MVADINVFGTAGGVELAADANGAIVVLVDSGRRGRRHANVSENLAKVKSLTKGLCQSNILSLSAGEGDNGLNLRVPGDGTTVEEEGVATGGTTLLFVLAVCVGGVTISFETSEVRRITSVGDAEVSGSLEVEKNSKKGGVVLFSGLLLYSAKLRDRSGNVRASQDAGIDEAAEQTLVQFLLVRGTWLGDVVLRVQLEVFRERKRSGREMVSREALDEVNDVILLAESDGTFRTITKDVTAKYPVEFTKIFDAELGVKGLLEVGDEEEGGGSDDEIINVDAKVASGTAIAEEVDTGVSLTLGEALLGEVIMKGEIPFTRRILETVDALVELQDLAFVVLSVEETNSFIHRRKVVSGVARSDKTEAFGDLEVGRLWKGSQEKGSVDITLVAVPIELVGQGEEDAKGGVLDDRAVDLVVVDTDLLGEALGNNSAFEAFHLTHGLLQLEDPHVADHVRTRR